MKSSFVGHILFHPSDGSLIQIEIFVLLPTFIILRNCLLKMSTPLNTYITKTKISAQITMSTHNILNLIIKIRRADLSRRVLFRSAHASSHSCRVQNAPELSKIVQILNRERNTSPCDVICSAQHQE